MRIHVSDYKKIATVGDFIETNGDGGTAVNEIFKGTVINVASEWFDMKNDQRARWTVNFKENGGSSFLWVDVLKSAKAVEMPKDAKPKVKKKIYITLEKDTQGISISIKIPEEIENYYKDLSKGETQESKGWFYKKGNGALFYKLSEEMIRNERRIDGETFSDFGNGLLRDGDINTAILRTVGASKGIKITSEHFSAVNNMDLEYYIKRLGIFIKRLWETSISKKTIKSIITYEL